MSFSQPTLIVIGGFSGSGKSTLAKSLSKTPEFAHFRVIGSDQVRRDLWAESNNGERPDKLPDKAYLDPEFKQMHYELVSDIVTNGLYCGDNIILHGTMTDDVVMPSITAYTSENGIPFYPIWLNVSEAVLTARVMNREDKDGSDADVNVLGFQLKKGLPSYHFHTIDGERAVADNVRSIIGMVANANPASTPSTPGF